MERFTPRISEVAWKHARALPSNCPGCVEADRPSTLFVEMKGGYLSLCCDIFHMKWWHCHARNSRTRASPRWVRARRVSAARGTGTSWGPAPSPRSPAAAWGGHLGFTTQLLFIKHESIVMLQNSEDCWAVQCRKHCCYGNQSCIIFVCFCNKTQYIYIYMCITFIRLLYLRKALLSFLPRNQQFNFRLGRYQNDDHYYSRCFFGGLCEFTDGPSSIDSDRCLHY